MRTPTYDEILAVIQRRDAEVRAAMRCGSRVYGTGDPDADHDFVVVLAEPTSHRDLFFRASVNVTVQGSAAFEAALTSQSVFALECALAPAEHQLAPARPPFRVAIDVPQLRASALERARSDFAKALRTYAAEPEPARKKLFHALRVLTFARHLAQDGRIDFAAARELHERVMTAPAATADDLEREFGPERAALEAALSELTRRR